VDLPRAGQIVLRAGGHPRIVSPELARQSPPVSIGGGKSGLRRARCQVTPGRREPTESATESIPPKCLRAPVRVKWCGKSAPRGW